MEPETETEPTNPGITGLEQMIGWRNQEIERIAKEIERTTDELVSMVMRNKSAKKEVEELKEALRILQSHVGSGGGD